MENSIENYLKVIFNLSQKDNSNVKSTDIASRLNISTPAVSEMLRKLVELDYIDHKPYKGVTLTKKGEQYGCNMVRRHRIWEMYLHTILGYPWHKVHSEAEKLEHASSDELINILDEKLGFPKTDPHGDPIPSKDGKMPKLEKMMQLSDCKPHKTYKVLRVVDFNEEFINYIDSVGIKPQSNITITHIRDFDKSITITLNKNEIALSYFSTQHIFVKEELQS